MAVELNHSKQMQYLKDKNSLLFDPAVVPLTSRTSSPASDFKLCARTSALKPANLQQVSVKAQRFSQGIFIVTEKKQLNVFEQ